ncbi:MAG: GAF domain-containing protein, partial [Pseudobdellovibrionaceae bacterium]
FESGEGMPGIVWRMKRAEWSRDIIKDMMLPRSLRAHNLGLDAGMWIPVIDKNNIFGVIEILGHRNELLTNGLAQFLQSIGEEVGHRLASGFES